MRWFPLLAIVLLVTSATARAQALAPSCYSPDRLGWAGPAIELGCLPCCGCRGGAYQMQWQHRLEDAGWTTQPISSVNARFAGTPFGTLTHLERYCTRVRYADDAGAGLWGPTNGTSCSDAGVDLCFTWDSERPSVPTMVDGGLIPGTNRVELHFAPSTDDGGGVLRYRFRYIPGAPPVGSFGNGPTSPISDIVGAGTWTMAVFAEDRAQNVSPNSATVVVTAGFDASVAAPPAPAWAVPITNQEYVDLVWPDDGAESWVVTQRTLDGGWAIGARPRVSGLTAYLNVPGPCRRHAGRIARVLGDQASDWSPPSPELLSDMVSPVVFPPTIVSFDGGAAELTWPAATDACPSGLTYFVERSLNGGPFTRRTTTTSTQYVDPIAVTGQLVWRIVAEDGAGNRGESDADAALFIAPPSDAGADAGEVDAGEPDAGQPAAPEDAGVVTQEQRTLAVGCGCEGGGTSALLFLLLAWLARRATWAA